MQIKLFTIPIIGGEKLEEELNVFLRSRKILQIESQLTEGNQGAFWCFCVKYLPTNIKSVESNSTKKRVDYKAVLDDQSFKRFSAMRVIRKAIAKEEAIPAYAVFTDVELAEIAKIEGELTASKLKSIKGIGEKKVEKYAQQIIKILADEKSE